MKKARANLLQIHNVFFANYKGRNAEQERKDQHRVEAETVYTQWKELIIFQRRSKCFNRLYTSLSLALK